MTGKEAGRSAQDRAERMQLKIERLQRSAAAWEAGAFGERATGEVLATLDPAEWSVNHDLRWPGRPRANIDHIAVGPSGVFVIDSKNWAGKVEVKDGVLRQNGYSRDKAVVGVAEAALAVAGVVPGVAVRGVLCFARDESVDEKVRDVIVCSTANLPAMLTACPSVLAADEVQRVATLLQSSLEGAGAAYATPTRARRTRATASARSGPSGWRILAFFLVVGLMIGSLQSGLWSKASDVIAELIVGSTVDTPDDPPAKKQRREERRADRQENDGR